MKRVELGRTGQTVSQISLGCMLMGTSTDEQTSERILNSYLEAGGDFLDTADCYAWWTSPESTGGESEKLLGRLLKGKRDKVFLATKVSALLTDYAAAHASGKGEPYYEGASAKVIRRGIDASLRRLDTDHIDLYYIHVDDMVTPLEETLEALDEIVRAGKVRYIGWSNVWTWRLERIHALTRQNGWRSAPVAVQQQHSYLRPVAGTRNVAGQDMLDYLAATDDISLAAYSPILGGVYEGRVDKPIWKQYAGPDAEIRLAGLETVAVELGVTKSQVVLAWLQQSERTIPIIGPRTWEHYEDYVPAFDLKLEPHHVKLLGQ
ncbi:aryl-alcohol dehydrogenase-like predicted oxidoreductase [Kibdelosporangium banguiense]|uniref:Aryl-alcohol dehydrogenase-like predicted oxidoreductase n=1 Tax=Kibdelosporangium banguiense TaxID=1365924 RepID=A0ABS4TBZ0_9PSEU|nr:aldo/keto reductase [Kibdelosporangium banguiense]MBP2321948.1 aryl-alcohol dehydrogenase-like predicted oxidoreductase [Kibdelosporangium banguiense]